MINFIKNYRPISLLLITGKFFLLYNYNQMFEFFIRNKLISQNKLGIKARFLCKSTFSTHEIYKSFDGCLDVRGVVLEISKAFEKASHQGLLYKFKQHGTSGNLLEILTDLLKYRKERVALNEQNSSSANVAAAVLFNLTIH